MLSVLNVLEIIECVQKINKIDIQQLNFIGPMGFLIINLTTSWVLYVKDLDNKYDYVIMIITMIRSFEWRFAQESTFSQFSSYTIHEPTQYGMLNSLMLICIFFMKNKYLKFISLLIISFVSFSKWKYPLITVFSFLFFLYFTIKVFTNIEVIKREIYLLKKKNIIYDKLINDFISTKLVILRMNDIDTRMEYFRSNKSFQETYKAKDLQQINEIFSNITIQDKNRNLKQQLSRLFVQKIKKETNKMTDQKQTPSLSTKKTTTTASSKTQTQKSTNQNSQNGQKSQQQNINNMPLSPILPALKKNQSEQVKTNLQKNNQNFRQNKKQQSLNLNSQNNLDTKNQNNEEGYDQLLKKIHQNARKAFDKMKADNQQNDVYAKYIKQKIQNLEQGNNNLQLSQSLVYQLDNFQNKESNTQAKEKNTSDSLQKSENNLNQQQNNIQNIESHLQQRENYFSKQENNDEKFEKLFENIKEENKRYSYELKEDLQQFQKNKIKDEQYARNLLNRKKLQIYTNMHSPQKISSFNTQQQNNKNMDKNVEIEFNSMQEIQQDDYNEKNGKKNNFNINNDQLSSYQSPGYRDSFLGSEDFHTNLRQNNFSQNDISINCQQSNNLHQNNQNQNNSHIYLQPLDSKSRLQQKNSHNLSKNIEENNQKSNQFLGFPNGTPSTDNINVGEDIDREDPEKEESDQNMFQTRNNILRYSKQSLSSQNLHAQQFEFNKKNIKFDDSANQNQLFQSYIGQYEDSNQKYFVDIRVSLYYLDFVYAIISIDQLSNYEQLSRMNKLLQEKDNMLYRMIEICKKQSSQCISTVISINKQIQSEFPTPEVTSRSFITCNMSPEKTRKTASEKRISMLMSPILQHNDSKSNQGSKKQINDVIYQSNELIKLANNCKEILQSNQSSQHHHQNVNLKIKEIQSVSVNYEINQIVKCYQMIKEKKKLSVRFDYSIENQSDLTTNVYLFRQLLHNLIGNAFDHSKYNKSIKIKVQNINELVKISIKNTFEISSDEILNKNQQRARTLTKKPTHFHRPSTQKANTVLQQYSERGNNDSAKEKLGLRASRIIVQQIGPFNELYFQHRKYYYEVSCFLYQDIGILSDSANKHDFLKIYNTANEVKLQYQQNLDTMTSVSDINDSFEKNQKVQTIVRDITGNNNKQDIDDNNQFLSNINKNEVKTLPDQRQQIFNFIQTIQ